MTATAWEITPDKVQTAINQIIAAGRPRKIVLFGSYVRGALHRHSDLDIMVVTDNSVSNLRKESVRLRRSLKGIGMPLDIIVVTEKLLADYGDAPGLVYREVLRTGEVVYDAASHTA